MRKLEQIGECHAESWLSTDRTG